MTVDRGVASVSDTEKSQPKYEAESKQNEPQSAEDKDAAVERELKELQKELEAAEQKSTSFLASTQHEENKRLTEKKRSSVPINRLNYEDRLAAGEYALRSELELKALQDFHTRELARLNLAFEIKNENLRKRQNEIIGALITHDMEDDANYTDQIHQLLNMRLTNNEERILFGLPPTGE